MNNLVKDGVFDRKRNLGAFYTPNSVSDILCEWAIRGAGDTILEPSFGGCGFLTSSVNRLRGLGNSSPGSQIYGCDIDPDAFKHLFNSVEPLNSRLSRRFLLKDFLSTSNRHWEQGKFDVVLGNPPYVAHKRLDQVQRRLGNLVLEENGLFSVGKANLWFFFVLHSLKFLKAGGRLALILPSTALESNFAMGLPDILQANFGTTHAITIKERMFKHLGVKEKCLVLLGESFGENNTRPIKNSLHFRNCKDLSEFGLLLKNPLENSKFNCSSKLSSGYSLLSKSQISSFESLQKSRQSRALSDFFNIRIGTVSGDKNFFVLKKSQCIRYGLDAEKFFNPVVSLSSQLEGVSLTSDDITNHINSDLACLLLDGDRSNFKSSRYRSYLNSYPLEKRAQNRTFSKRDLWYSVPTFSAPDLFLPYMAQLGPRLVLNEAGVINTNNVHRVDLKEGAEIPGIKGLARISIMSTYSQLCAELFCRHYGSGVLKIEPGDAKNLKILCPKKVDRAKISSCLKKIDKATRASDFTEAHRVADEFIHAAMPSINYAGQLADLKSALSRVRSSRY